MENKKEDVLINTIYESKGSENFVYEVVEGGMYLASLVKVKNVTIERLIEGVKTAKPGYRFTFRLKDHPNCYVHMKMTSTTSEMGKLLPLLKKMTGGKLPANANPETCFKAINWALGRWFDIMVEKIQYQGKDMNFITDGVVIPAKNGEALGSGIEYFKNLPPSQPLPVQQTLPTEPVRAIPGAPTGGYDPGHDITSIEEDDIPW